MKKTTFPPQTQKRPGKESAMSPQPEYIRDDYKGSEKLSEKVALITGGDSGIGRSVAVHFAREGADVAITYLNEKEDALETKRLVEEEGQRCLLLKGDLKKEAFCRRIVLDTLQTFGTLNILVNNAALHYPKEHLRDLETEDIHLTFETNIFPLFFTVMEALKTMKQGDSIINTSSVVAYRGSEHLVDYASTKGAIVSFTRSLAMQLAEKGIRVNGVAPGPIWTPLIPSSFDAKHVSEFGSSTPMKRAGQPSEVAPAFVFLAAEDSSYITGHFIHVNGGDVMSS
ncbi:MAG: SDR family oxidoreductase [Bacteroidota bacterium]